MAVDIRRQQRLAGGEGESFKPLVSVLLATAIGAADHRVRRGALAEHLTAGGIEDDRFGALSAAVYAEEELSGCHVGSSRLAVKIKSHPLTPTLSPKGARGEREQKFMLFKS